MYGSIFDSILATEFLSNMDEKKIWTVSECMYIIKFDFYNDVGGADTIEGSFKLRNPLFRVMNRRGFPLRK